MPSQTSKRKRVPESRPGTSHEDNKHATFTKWAEDRGVKIKGIKAAHLPGRGVGLVTTTSIAEGERLLSIPEKAMFKPDAAMLRREGLRAASPQAHLAVSAMFAFGNPESGLKIWRDEWPSNESFEHCMPMCWPTPLRELLPHPVQQPLSRQLADLEKDWREVRSVCLKHGFTEDDFKYYWMIVNSRSFHWKPPHSRGGMMVMCPFIDYMNHGPTDSGCKVTQGPAGYEVVAERTYEPGEEILATYGAHSNDKLLVHYGFICSSPQSGPSPDDEIRLDHLIIPSLDSSIRDQLQDVGFLGGYSLSPSTNEICFKTEVAVRATLLTSNEWEYFVSNGEDLGEDQSQEVARFLKALLVPYREEVLLKLEELEAMQNAQAAAQELLKGRWDQILNATDGYLQAP